MRNKHAACTNDMRNSKGEQHSDRTPAPTREKKTGAYGNVLTLAPRACCSKPTTLFGSVPGTRRFHQSRHNQNKPQHTRIASNLCKCHNNNPTPCSLIGMGLTHWLCELSSHFGIHVGGGRTLRSTSIAQHIAPRRVSDPHTFPKRHTCTADTHRVSNGQCLSMAQHLQVCEARQLDQIVLQLLHVSAHTTQPAPHMLELTSQPCQH